MIDPTGFTNLLEALDGPANTLSHFRQFLGPKNQSCDSSNNHQLGHAKTKQSVAGETLLRRVSSGPGSEHNQSVTFAVGFVQESGGGKAGEKGGVGGRERERRWRHS